MLCWGEGMRAPGQQEDPIPAARLHRPHELLPTGNRACGCAEASCAVNRSFRFRSFRFRVSHPLNPLPPQRLLWGRTREGTNQGREEAQSHQRLGFSGPL